MREKREVSLTTRQKKATPVEKFARFRQVASEDPSALSDALVELSAAFSSMAEASEALIENLDLSPTPKEASIREKVAARKKFATNLKKLAEESPEKVEEAVNEIYNAVDEVALALENLAGNLGFQLGEIEDEVVEDGVIEDEAGFESEASLNDEIVDEGLDEGFEEAAPITASKKPRS